MKLSTLIIGLSLSATITTTIALKNANAQLLNVKPWHGYYPEMNDDYPLSFIAFKGWLFPVPHVFVRTWPTHYYMELGALPVSDGAEYAGQTKTGLLRIATKLLERWQIKGRHDETSQIKDNTELQKIIEEKLFNARKDALPDIYGLAEQFISLYQKIGNFDRLENSSKVKHILRDEADDLLMRFLMVNLLESNHGAKLESFAGIQSELYQLVGETDYTYRKLCHLNVFGNAVTGSYAFLTR
ncbi:hypothetical protein [Sunxiuqinia dokdonensis]|uniref:Uncharacterized protein n=1 Tax=Sunxiuqinia dokdonensis TaxID=1409788 RepID=A0A0L8V5G4_9BACT|nr:hypothetical protein [Sunxiuqinia dokdonensis]KOH43661.1 hypothetical protein NC99_35810 [Sunxiuqinia dokdonensis]